MSRGEARRAAPCGTALLNEKAGLCYLSYGLSRRDLHPDLRASVERLVVSQQDQVPLLPPIVADAAALVNDGLEMTL